MPTADLSRIVAAMPVALGIPLPLFGFSEIMSDTCERRRDRP